MNEQIAELALQAGFSSWVICPSKETATVETEKLNIQLFCD